MALPFLHQGQREQRPPRPRDVHNISLTIHQVFLDSFSTSNHHWGRQKNHPTTPLRLRIALSCPRSVRWSGPTRDRLIGPNRPTPGAIEATCFEQRGIHGPNP